MVTKAAAAEDFRYISMLLAVKTGAAVMPIEELRHDVMDAATKITFDALLTRLLAAAITLQVWEYGRWPKR